MAAPPLPPGFTLDQPAASAPPPLPPGFTLDAAAQAPIERPQPLRAGTEAPRALADVALRHPFTTLPGMIENGFAGLTSQVGSLADAVTMADPGTHDWTYRPRTQAGQELSSVGSRAGVSIGNTYDKIAGEGPLAATLKERVPEALGAIGVVTGARMGVPAAVSTARGAGTVLRNATRPAPMTAEEVLSKQALQSPQSMGAAASAPNLQNVSPELRQSIVTAAQRTGGSVNPAVLSRHIEADTLPVPVRLTEGQATGDVVRLSQEQNMRGKVESFAKRFDDQNKALGQNMQQLRDDWGADVYTASPVEHGDTLIAAYKAKDAAANTQISAAYDALRSSAGGTFPVSAPGILQSASRELHQKLLFDHAPQSVMKTLARLAEKDSMTFENFESLRTNLARVMRSSADGNERAAAGVIRQAMEDLPLQPQAAALKPLADKARALAKSQFQAVEADPAYAAAVHDTVAPDHFVSRFVIRGTRDDLEKMRTSIGSEPSVAQTMGVAALDHLREQARLNPHYEGNFASASFNKALVKMSPNLKSLLPPKAVEQLEQLGRVSGYTTYQPRGSFVNNSNTFVAGAREAAAGAAEGAANVAAYGIPVGTWTRKALQKRAIGRDVNRSLAPGAGLDKLPEKS